MAYIIILIGTILRVIPHPANFAPIGALAFFSGAHLSRKQALILPIAAMLISDYFLGFDSLASRLSVYGSFIAFAGIGMLLKNRKTVKTVVLGSLAGSLIFYLVTNFVFFHSYSLYPHTFQGMIMSYINAIPFFRNTLMSDLFYSAVFFGSYALVNNYLPRFLAKWQESSK
jgi:hypothetical protein